MLRWWRALTPEGALIMLNLGTVVVSIALWLAATAFEAVMAPSPRPVVHPQDETLQWELEPHVGDADLPEPLPESWLIVVPQAEIVEP